ncbi:hypothetical protein [Brevibacterium sediminis]|uniref:Uncharacterized protein n=1 Tax=Brevibacterium sediminis TaxID=1857024 RepID=A0A5C4X9F2_9MICO|nr:hypothetical protein [Brevibacterium sediminis]TNM58158.1 hypothetical protein FHQ09_02490 [Brevibacterium sediminis]
MAHYSSFSQGNRAAVRKKLRSLKLQGTSETPRERHSSHRTKLVRIRGLALNPPTGNDPIEVCVNIQSDWDMIYKTPSIHVKCSVESCDTLLTAKRMSRSGLRFFAVRSGGCSHNLVEMPVGREEVAQDPSKLAGGGGPEGEEHLWIKGRLFKIARKLGVQAVVEHSLTRADVFLPERKLVLEYQRWATDFRNRTAQRASAGAKDTVWMFPWQPPGAPQTKAVKEFNREVFQHGGIYVAVRNKDARQVLERPWENSAQERTARLYASGSIAMFDQKLGTLVRKELSLATVLSQIINRERVLARVPVLTKSSGQMMIASVWVLHNDLRRADAAQTNRQLKATSVSNSATTPAVPKVTKPTRRPIQEVSGESESTGEPTRDCTSIERESAHNSGEPYNLPNCPGPTLTEQNAQVESAQIRPPRVTDAELSEQIPVDASPPTRRPWWKAVADWLREM